MNLRIREAFQKIKHIQYGHLKPYFDFPFLQNHNVRSFLKILGAAWILFPTKTMDFNFETKLDNMKSLQTNMKDKSGKATSEVFDTKTALYSTFRIGFRCVIKSKRETRWNLMDFLGKNGVIIIIKHFSCCL